MSTRLCLSLEIGFSGKKKKILATREKKKTPESAQWVGKDSSMLTAGMTKHVEHVVGQVVYLQCEEIFGFISNHLESNS